MTPEEWIAVQALYGAALDQPAGTRLAYVRETAPDPAIGHEVERMLRAPPASSFLEPPELGDPGVGRNLGEFTLVERIGEGGMGVVFKARQERLQRLVAVKVLPANLTLTRRQVERFESEARAAARLQHPGIASILTFGEDQGTYWFAMEYVEGESLAQAARRGALDDFGAVAEVVRQAADALHHAHEAGVVHRDVKPGNLLLGPGGRVKVVDFGLARDAEETGRSPTREGEGTPHYMSPEQAGARRQPVDHRTDVYSLGVVLYELLAGRKPFDGSTHREILEAIVSHDAPRLRRVNPRVPRDLELLCDRAMARDPRDRFASAAELRDELGRFLAHEALRTEPPSILQRIRRRLARRRKPLTLTVGVLAALALGAWGTRQHDRRELREDLRERLSRAALLGDLGELAPSRVVQVQRDLQAYHAAGGREALAAGPDDPCAVLARRLEELRERLKREGETSLRNSRDPSLPESSREFHRLRGLQTLRDAAYLFPGDEELTGFAELESLYPSISVNAVDAAGTPIPATVYRHAIDPFTTRVLEAEPLGETPLGPVPIQPGSYRLVVVFEAGGFRELVCSPDPALPDLELVARRHADEDAITRDMVRLGPATYTFPEQADDWPLEGQSVDLPAFDIDRTEVSNADYQAFVEATGHAQPTYWRLEPDLGAFLDAHGDLPVVGVTWPDAVAYAEWRGKRLPTASEWMLAAAGVENRELPYAAHAVPPLLGNVNGPALTSAREADTWQAYLENAEPVWSHPEARSPEGLFHLFGNVKEFSESTMVLFVAPGIVTQKSRDRLLMGAAWNAAQLGQSIRTVEWWDIGPYGNAHDLGFRCAKSAAP